MAKKPTPRQKTCFVVMGYGTKTDFETGRTLNLDRSYYNIIKPAVVEAGLQCVRADEIVHSGLIDVPMYQQLLEADVVVADLSTSNKNAFYELGIRHALRPFTTVVIAEEGLTIPFDVNHVVVRRYKHLGEDIGFDETMRFRKLLTEALVAITGPNAAPDCDSPVYKFLQGLHAPSLLKVAQAAVERVVETNAFRPTDAGRTTEAAAGAGPPPRVRRKVKASASPTHSALMQQVSAAQNDKQWPKAKKLLQQARAMQQESGEAGTYLLRELAFATYKNDPKHPASLLEARDLLRPLEMATHNDAETLALWGNIHGKLWELNHDLADLNEAVRAYERGFYLRNDSYNGVRCAYLLNLRATHAPTPSDAIADFVQAARIRREVIALCAQWLLRNPVPRHPGEAPEAAQACLTERYWTLVNQGEAYLGLGDEVRAQELLQVPDLKVRSVAEGRYARLRPLLTDTAQHYRAVPI